MSGRWHWTRNEPENIKLEYPKKNDFQQLVFSHSREPPGRGYPTEKERESVEDPVEWHLYYPWI